MIHVKNIRNIAESGTPSNDILTGTIGRDTLDGGMGADTMAGLAGSDVYYVDHAGDQVIEQSGEGNDTVYATVSYTLSDGVERLILTSSANLDGTGNDQNNGITGNAGHNILNGEAGADRLNGGRGDDVLNGGEGNDTLTVMQGNDTVDGGSGVDTFVGNWSASTTAISWNNTGPTPNTMVINGVQVSGVEYLTLTTGSGDDSIHNDASTSDAISTGNGNDTIDAGVGNDTVDAGAGNDLIHCSAYSPWTVLGSHDGSDIVQAGSGDDQIVLVSGQDTVDGGDGYDRVYAHLATSSASSGYNSAWLWNATGNTADNIRVDASSDWNSINALVNTEKHLQFWTSTGTAGFTLDNIESFSFTGAVSNDLLFAKGNVAGATFDGGNGIDTFFANWSGITTSVHWNNGMGGADTQNHAYVVNVERLLIATGSGNDSISNTSSETNDDIRTGNGNDTISAGLGNDIITAGSGNDLIYSGAHDPIGAGNTTAEGNDKIDAGSGNDHVMYISGQDTVNGGDGYDFAQISLADISGTGTSGWLWNATGSANDNATITASADWSSVKTLVNTAKHLQFVGADASMGPDLYNIESLNLFGAQSNDLIFAMGSGNTYDGGDGTDTFFADWSYSSSAIVWNDGALSSPMVGSNAMRVLNMERLLLSTGSGSDSIDNTACDAADEIRTNSGQDTIYAGAGNDTVYAGGGQDLLVGGSGDDLLIGGGGYDTLDLRDGGHDTVKLDMVVGHDTVIGFVSGSDGINIRQSLRVGNADAVVNDGTTVSNGNASPFATSAELVVFTDNISGSLNTMSAASVIGHASSHYSAGQQALFAVDNGIDSQLYLFTSTGNDATVSADELTLLATLTGTASTAVGDYVFSL